MLVPRHWSDGQVWMVETLRVALTSAWRHPTTLPWGALKHRSVLHCLFPSVCAKYVQLTVAHLSPTQLIKAPCCDSVPQVDLKGSSVFLYPWVKWATAAVLTHYLMPVITAGYNYNVGWLNFFKHTFCTLSFRLRIWGFALVIVSAPWRALNVLRMHRWHPAAGSGTAAGADAASVAPGGSNLMLCFTLPITTFTRCAGIQYNNK